MLATADNLRSFVLVAMYIWVKSGNLTNPVTSI